MKDNLQNSCRALVLLMDCGDLRKMFENWPAHMHLAVCIKEDGDCRLLVYRAEEGARFLPRLRSALNLRMPEICFVPEQEGFATRKLLFSEEEQLLSVVRNSPEIVEEATDYSANYCFAMEEGLDPIRFLQNQRELSLQKPVAREPEPQAGMQEPEPEPAVQEPEVSAQPQTEPGPADVRIPRFMQVASGLEPGPGFQSMEEIRLQTRAPDYCLISDEANGWVYVDLPGCSGGQVTTSNPGRIFLRDDHRMIAIYSDVIGTCVTRLPGRVRIGVRHLPAKLRSILAAAVGQAGLSYENGFLFISIDTASRRATQPVMAKPRRPGRGRQMWDRIGRQWRTWATVGGVAVVAAGLFGFQSSGGQDRTAGTTGAIDWNRFQTDATDPPLDIASERINRILSEAEG